MKTFILSSIFLLGTVQGHYNFVRIEGSGIQASDWQYMRKVADRTPMYQITDMDTDNLRCNVGQANPAPGIQSLPIKAGSTIGFKINGNIVHPGPLLGYMVKVPAGTTAASWNPSGKVWFKTSQDNIKSIAPWPIGASSDRMIWWENTNKTDVQYTIPKSLPDGEYLFRAEQIGLHGTIYPEDVGGGPQFFVSCAHLLISGGGTGTPGPLVEFPGEYKRGDPGLSLHAYRTNITWDELQALNYQPPGPPVWVG